MPSSTVTSEITSEALKNSAISTLKSLQRQHIDPLLAATIDQKARELRLEFADSEGGGLREIDQLLFYIKDFLLRPGKRFRPALLYMAYKGFGGKDEQSALTCGVAAELIHAYLLVHDDIIDEDRLRRGGPAMHELYRGLYSRSVGLDAHEITPRTRHVGESMAIVAGDILQTFAQDLLLALEIDSAMKISIMRELNVMTQKAGYGELIDVWKSLFGDIHESDILQIYDLKTAQYTMQGPLMMAARLAGVEDRNTLKALARFSYHVGLIYQIRDDVIGMFGTEEKIGKPVGSDIKEGKETILVHFARAHADRDQLSALNHALGNKNLTAADVARTQEILRTIGAEEYCMQQMNMHKEQALSELERIHFTQETSDFLEGILDYMVDRSS